MLGFFKAIIDAIWGLMSIPFTIDNIELKVWYFPFLGLIIGSVLRMIYGGKEGAAK